MPYEDAELLEFNQIQISGKVPFIIYADLIFNGFVIDGCKNSPENSFTAKVSEDIPSDFPVSSFKTIENKNDVYRAKDSMKQFCESWRDHTMEIINIKKKKPKLLTKEQYET